ncbi:hypothetical protein Pcinc_027942 [Petrolisthes cinctipes]|uniref:Uncharacterized protein n=1 Tax=Petrolisthes cinctipes TaxID=88211 RepID=A0AAE1K7Z1_PETCI|nr:hypothetical protein Pcinc_027942 [Petrolisthes cinctipes]
MHKRKNGHGVRNGDEGGRRNGGVRNKENGASERGMEVGKTMVEDTKRMADAGKGQRGKGRRAGRRVVPERCRTGSSAMSWSHMEENEAHGRVVE